jgi:hypothetical protein
METLEPWLSEIVEAELRAYVGAVDEEELAWMRERIVERLATDAELSRVARDARPRSAADESGKAAQADVVAGLSAEERDAIAPRRR